MTLTRFQAARILGLHPNAIAGLQMAGVIRSSGNLTLMQVFAISVAISLRKLEFAYAQVTPVADYLWSLPQETWEAQLAQGRHYFLCIGKMICPTPLTLEACKHPKGIDLVEFERISGQRASTYDLALVWSGLCIEALKSNATTGNRQTGSDSSSAANGQTLSRVSPDNLGPA